MHHVLAFGPELFIPCFDYYDFSKLHHICLGSANSFTTTPANVTTCLGLNATFTCATNQPAVLLWNINGEDYFDGNGPVQGPSIRIVALQDVQVFCYYYDASLSHFFLSPKAFLFVKVLPAAPKNLTVMVLNATAIKLSWVPSISTEPSAPINYMVVISSENGTGFYNITTNEQQTVISNLDHCLYNACIAFVTAEYTNFTCVGESGNISFSLAATPPPTSQQPTSLAFAAFSILLILLMAIVVIGAIVVLRRKNQLPSIQIEMADHTNNVHLEDVHEAKPLEVKRYSEYLKAVYKRTQVGGDQWPHVKTQHYVELLTVEKIEDMSKDEDKMFTMARMTSKIEVKEMRKPAISMEQVGTLSNGEKASCIIVEGIPGIGKSAFSWHLGASWAQKKILNDYHLVVLLRLRDERVKHAKCVDDLFYYKEQTDEEHEAVIKWVKAHNGVLLILDGYDELPSDLQTSSIFADIIKGEVLPKMTVLVTSRPSANQTLQELCGSQKCQYIEVIGFGKEEIQEYVDGALECNTELREQLKMYLECHPHIHGLMYVPLNCAIIVQVFRDEMEKKNQPPETVTEVYQVLIKTLVKRHEKKHNSTPTNPNKPSRFAWLIGVSEETILQLLVLAKLAYDGTEKDELIFHWTNGAMETLGLLQEVPQLYLDSSGSSSYNFLHKTIQEFMAALYISSLPPDEKAQIVKTSMKKSNMKIVMRFIAGLTKFQSHDDIKGQVEFMQKGILELMESLHFLFEAHDPELVHKCMRDRGEDLEPNVPLDPLDCYVLGYCIANSRKTWKLNLKGCFITGVCLKMLMIVECGKAFDYITSIDLRFNKQLGDEGGIVLGEILRKNKVFTQLGLWACGLGPVGLSKLCSALEENTTLTSLDLSSNNFDEQSTIVLGEMLRKNKALTSLVLKDYGLCPEGLCKVCSALEENTALTSLDLSQNTFDEQSTKSLGVGQC